MKQNPTQPEVDPALIWDPKQYTSVKHLLEYGNAACVYETGYETPVCFWKWFHTMTASSDRFKVAKRLMTSDG